ncbi:MAG: hypothetical protein L6416_07850 [Candidatus Omnitrophica bacterium]|nr:hypothetical protein [Candidatus Omnitrophota bacterium]
MGKLTIVWNDQVLDLFNALWSATIFWRSLSFFLIGVLIMAFLFKDSIKRVLLKENANRHDKEIFHLFDLIMSENKLNDILGLLEKKHFYNKKSGDYVDKFSDSLQEESRQYINIKIRKASMALSAAIKQLREFIDKNFLVFPNGHEDGTDPEGMYPNPEIDGGGNEKEKNASRFNKFNEELKMLIGSLRNKYKRYRNLIKQNLHI